MQWHPVNVPATPAPANLGVKLLAPQAVPTVQQAVVSQDDAAPSRIVRAQAFDPNFPPPGGPVPPPPPPPPPPGSLAGAPNDEKYNCAVKANCNSGGGPGFYDQARDAVTGIPGAMGNIFTTNNGRALFQSDHCFDYFCSPVSNPFFSEDPRALTEIKPLVIYDHVPNSNFNFQGGNIWF
jgi:hypothetical protein